MASIGVVDGPADVRPYSYDDLLEEEREEVWLAIKRLSAKESYERVYRIRRATQLSIQHKLLPKEEWTKPEDVRRNPTNQDMSRKTGDTNIGGDDRIPLTSARSSTRSRPRWPRRTPSTP